MIFQWLPVRSFPDDWPVRVDPFSNFRSRIRGPDPAPLQSRADAPPFRRRRTERCPPGQVHRFPIHHQRTPSFRSSRRSHSRDIEKTRTMRSEYLKRDLPPVTFEYLHSNPKSSAISPSPPGRRAAAPFPRRARMTLMDISATAFPISCRNRRRLFILGESRPGSVGSASSPSRCSARASRSAEASVSFGTWTVTDWRIWWSRPPFPGSIESHRTADGSPSDASKPMPSFSLDDPNTRLVDLTGDGLQRCAGDPRPHFLWYRCRRRSRLRPTRGRGRVSTIWMPFPISISTTPPAGCAWPT